MSAVSSLRTFGVLVTVMPPGRRLHVDIVDTVGETGDQFELGAGLLDERMASIRSVSVGAERRRFDGGDEFGLAARRVVDVEFRVERF